MPPPPPPGPNLLWATVQGLGKVQFLYLCIPPLTTFHLGWPTPPSAPPLLCMNLHGLGSVSQLVAAPQLQDHRCSRLQSLATPDHGHELAGACSCGPDPRLIPRFTPENMMPTQRRRKHRAHRTSWCLRMWTGCPAHASRLPARPGHPYWWGKRRPDACGGPSLQHSPDALAHQGGTPPGHHIQLSYI